MSYSNDQNIKKNNCLPVIPVIENAGRLEKELLGDSRVIEMSCPLHKENINTIQRCNIAHHPK